MKIDVDAVVFDIDGVLVDSSRSFRKVIAKTVQFYFENILKFKGNEQLVKQEEIKLFKDVGGFNNDWELTESLVLFYLCKSALLDSKELAVLRFQEPFMEGYVRRGVDTFQKAVFSFLDSEKDKQAAVGLWNKPLVRQIFQEFYAGDGYCQDYYGFSPVYVKGEGLIKKEVSLINNSLVTKPVAVVTGRTAAETKGALKLTGLEVACQVVVCDNGKFKRKPNPEALLYISDKMGIKTGIYIGDAMDDLLMVENFNKESPDKRFLSAIVTSTPEKFKKADITASSVNEVLRMVPGG